MAAQTIRADIPGSYRQGWCDKATYAEFRGLFDEILPSVLDAVSPDRIILPAPPDVAEARADWPYTQIHTHSFPELVACIGGDCVLAMPPAQVELRAGDLALIPSGVAHNEACMTPGEAYNLLWTFSDGGTTSFSTSHYSPGNGTATFRVLMYAPVRAVVDELLSRAEAEIRVRRDGYLAAVADYLRAFYRSALRCEGAVRSHEPPVVSRASAFIHAHFSEAVTASTVASALNIPPKYLGPLFRRWTGLSLTEYIRHVRMKRAMHLLAVSHEPIGSIARQCGYSDPLYFSRVCARWAGMPPRMLRVHHGAPARATDDVDKDRWQGSAWRPGSHR